MQMNILSEKQYGQHRRSTEMAIPTNTVETRKTRFTLTNWRINFYNMTTFKKSRNLFTQCVKKRLQCNNNVNIM